MVYLLFVANFACIATPLNEKVKRYETDMLNTFMQEEHDAVAKVQKKLVSASVVVLPCSNGKLPLTRMLVIGI